MYSCNAFLTSNSYNAMITQSYCVQFTNLYSSACIEIIFHSQAPPARVGTKITELPHTQGPGESGNEVTYFTPVL